MLAIGAGSAGRAAGLLASTSLVALVFSSSAAFSSCTFNSTILPDSHVLALSGDSCFVSGTYSTTTSGLIAGRASGGVIFGTFNGDGYVGSVSFSTSASFTPALQADTGGSINLDPGPNTATVTTSGDNSVGILVTGANSTFTALGVDVTTGAVVDGAITGANSVGLLAVNGGTATFTGGSITTIGTNAPAVLSQAGEGGASITLNGGTTILTFGRVRPAWRRTARARR